MFNSNDIAGSVHGINSTVYRRSSYCIVDGWFRRTNDSYIAIRTKRRRGSSPTCIRTEQRRRSCYHTFGLHSRGAVGGRGKRNGGRRRGRWALFIQFGHQLTKGVRFRYGDASADGEGKRKEANMKLELNHWSDWGSTTKSTTISGKTCENESNKPEFG